MARTEGREPAPSRRQEVEMIEAVQLAPEERMAKPRLVFFFSRQSGRCRRAEGFMAQVLQRRRNHDTFTLYRVDTDERPELGKRFGITTLPTLVVVDGK